MNEAFLCDAVRTPFGRYGGALSGIRTDDLAALPLKALLERNASLDPKAIDDVIFGCANQAGEDNRNVARMASLLVGLPVEVPGATVNRLCGSGMEAVIQASRAVQSGGASLVIAGGVESMSRAPYVMTKPGTAFSRDQELADSTLGWRFINPRMKELHGVDSLTETAENVAAEHGVTRADQDAYAFRSQQRTAAALSSGRLAEEIIPVTILKAKGDPVVVRQDEQPRPDSTMEGLAKLKPLVGPKGTVTAGNCTGLNDGAGALIVASKESVARFGLKPIARFVGSAVAGVPPRVMGIGPIPSSKLALERAGLKISAMDVIEISEAFAAQVVASLRGLGVADDAPHVNPNGGSIAIGHPLGASGTRLITAAMYELRRSKKRYALCTMCIGVGQGIAVIIERV